MNLGRIWMNGGAIAVLAAASLTSQVAFAQQTASTIRGVVTTSTGAPVGGANVSIEYVPTATTDTTTSSSGGAFFESGLRVGGPYKITVTASGYKPQTIDGVTLQAGESAPFTIALVSDQVAEEITVTAQVTTRIPLNNGVGTSFTAADIANQPAGNHDLIRLLIKDPLANSSGAIGNLSVAGVNPRFNALAVDGALLQDDFGLSTSTYPTNRPAVSLDWTEAAAIVASDYSVTSTGFQGGLVNVVTRSGTNEIHGSAFYNRSQPEWNGSEAFDTPVPQGQFLEEEYGFALGGPILKDKLFVFGGWEKYANAPAMNFGGDDAQDNIADPTIFDALQTIIEDRLGYTPAGRPGSTNRSQTTERWLAKVDWNITDQHRADASISKIEETDVTVNNLSFADAWYDAPIEMTTYTAHLYSDWTDNLSTTLRFAYKDFMRGQDCRAGHDVGEIQIRLKDTDLSPGAETLPAGVPSLIGMLTGGSERTFIAGCDRFRHANTFADTRMQVFASADYRLGDHVITGGMDYEDYNLANLFIDSSQGVFVFETLEDLLADRATRVDYKNVATNNAQEGEATWGYQKLSVFAQDEWQILSNLSVNAGIRYERFIQSDEPPLRPDFVTAFGYPNTKNLDGLDSVQPRIGFHYEPFSRTTIEGGVGLFSGGDPKVWISNAFQPQINFATVANFVGADPSVVPPGLLSAVAAGSPGPLDLIASDFEIPSQWKASARLIQLFDVPLPWSDISLGNDYVFTLEYLWSNVEYGYRWKNLAQTDLGLATGIAPDGRPIYPDLNALGIQNAIALTNFKEGGSNIIATSLSKRYDNGIDFSVSYAHQDVETSSPGTSSRGVSNWRDLFDFDRNNPHVGRAAFEVEHKFAVNLGYENEFVTDLKSRFDIFGIITSGEPFSYAYQVSSSNALFGRAGSGESPFNNDLVYIPAVSGGAFSDPKVVFKSTFPQASFMSYIGRNSIPTGDIVPKNLKDSEWNRRWDFRFQQDLPFANLRMERFKNNKLKLIVDVQNVLNFLNHDWGRQTNANGFDGVAIVGADLITAAAAAVDVDAAPALTGNAPATNCTTATTCVYRYNTFTAQPSTFKNLTDSVYKIHIGVKYEF